MHHSQDIKMVKQILIEQQWVLNKMQINEEGRMYITVQSFNQRSIPKIYHVIDAGNDVKQMELLRDTIYIYVVLSISFQTFLYRHLKLS